MDNASRKPMLLCFAGPNGSGKSTITKFFEIAGEYTNADDVVSSTGMGNEEAAKFVDKKRYDSIKAKSDLTFETVLSSKYKMDILRKSRDEGYFIKCVFVLTADPKLNVARVESRVMQGGHDVDSEKVKTRFYKSLANIKDLMSLCDILHVYDNTDTPYRIIRKHKDSITIFPNEYWDEEDIIALITGTYSQRYLG